MHSERIEIACETCGKRFEAYASDKPRKRFCSKKCLGISNGKRKTAERVRAQKSCLECGKVFEVRPCTFERTKFCCRACNALWYGRQRRIVSPTNIEIALHVRLRALGVPFEVEHRIGRRRVDIGFPEAKLAVEADGTYWHSLAKQKVADARKDAFLSAEGWTVLRLSESAINADPDECVQRILAVLRQA